MSREKPDVTRAQPECAVLLVSFPHQLLHALSALKHDRVIRGVATDSPATLVVWSYQTQDHQPASAARRFFERALSHYPFISTLIFSRKERNGPLSAYRSVMGRARWLEHRLSDIGACLTFYYAHDASSDHTAQAFMQALSAERNICYGDAPGFLYPSARPSRIPLTFDLRSLKEVFWQSRQRGVKQWLAADTALIAINFDDQVDGVAFPQAILVPTETVIETLHSLKASFSEIEDFEHQMMQATTQRTLALLIMSNFSKSKLMSQSNELALYIDICNAHLKAGDRLYIKKHAGTSPIFAKQLVDALGAYETQQFPAHLEHLPIELFTALHAQCKVISVSSASALLTLISGNLVVHALTQQHINNLFSQAHRDYMSIANNRILRHTAPQKDTAPEQHTQ